MKTLKYSELGIGDNTFFIRFFQSRQIAYCTIGGKTISRYVNFSGGSHITYKNEKYFLVY